MKAVLDNLIERYPALACCREQIEKAADILVECYRKDGKLLTETGAVLPMPST